MSVIRRINRLFSARPKAFLVDDVNRCSEEDIEAIKSLNVDVERFPDFNSLLYNLRKRKHNKYKVGLIHESEAKYSSQMLLNFIKSIDPTIQLIVYKDISQLRLQAKSMILT